MTGHARPGPGRSDLLAFGQNISWSRLGETVFRAIATAPGMADSEVSELSLRIIRELYVEYPMHHKPHKYYLWDDGTPGEADEEEADEEGEDQSARPEAGSHPSSEGDHNITANVTSRGNETSISTSDNPTTPISGDLAPSSTNDTSSRHPHIIINPKPSHLRPPGNTTANGTMAQDEVWRPNNYTNSSLVPVPHKRYRRPFNIQGYEGVQPVVSLHVVEAHFKDCTYCTPRKVRGRLATVDNPSRHFSLLQPLHSCGKGLELPSVSGRGYELPERPTMYVPVGFNKTQLGRLNQLTDSQYRDVKDLGCQVRTNKSNDRWQ